MNRHVCTVVVCFCAFATTQHSAASGQQPPDTSAGAMVVVHAPANAMIEVEGKAVEETGPVRRVQTSPLEPMRTYTYTVKATWDVDGVERSEERKVLVRAGRTVEVFFGAFEGNAEARAVLELVNQERQKTGAPPVILDATLCQVAQAHSDNMAGQDTLSHDLDGKAFWERIEEAGYPQAGSGENCAAGAENPTEAMQMWMNSQGHRSNILDPNFRELGVGSAIGKGKIRYWTQVFAARKD